MTRGRVVPAALVGALLIVGLACDDSTEPPVPGSVTISLNTPNTDDGAVALTLTGPGLSNLVPTSSSLKVFWRLVAENELRALVFGNLTSGPVFSVDVQNVNTPSLYSATITQVATRDDELRADMSGYTVTVAGVATP